MGEVLGKLLKTASETKTVSVEGSIVGDPRSPTEGVYRTPLGQEKRPYLETDLDDVTPTVPLRVRLLKKSIDPRSPSAGILRTPIALLPDPEEFDSPVSLYSNYQSDFQSLTCLDSPPEPSVNVSDFETETFNKELDSLVEKINASFSDSETPNDDSKPPLKLRRSKSSVDSLLENRKMCESLVNEIVESFQEFQSEVVCKKGSAKSNKKGVKKLALLPAPLNENQCTPKLRKSRKPLSNITASAGNTPTRTKLHKEEKLVKIEKTGENSPMVNGKARAQWDNDTTVII